jgi:energy-coupling factor transporter ATP-binding protein EcfA2
VGHVDVAHLSHTLPNGRVLLDDVSFRVGDGTTAALVGPNGAGKTTLIRLIAGDLSPQSGTVAVSGGLGVMRQFVGGIRGVVSPGKRGAGGDAPPGPGSPEASGDTGGPGAPAPASGQLDTGRVTGASPVRDLLISVAPPRVQAAADRLDAAELAMMERDDEPT